MKKKLAPGRVLVGIASLSAACAIAILVPASVAGATNAGDPHTTGCDQTAITGKSIPVYAHGSYLGSLNLRYSNSCQTEWVTFYAASYAAATGYYFQPSVWMQNQSGTDLYTAPSSPFIGWMAYTNQ